MCFWDISIIQWIYVYHYLRSYLLTKELSFRGIYSLIDSLCQNLEQKAIVFFELNKCRVHPCAQMVYVNSLDYMFLCEISIIQWIYVYHYFRSYLLTKELSFRGIFSLMDSLCQNYKQNAIVFFELNKFRFHPCAQMVYVNSLDYVFSRTVNQ